MKIPIKILLSSVTEPVQGETWGDVISNWESYALEWNASSGLGVDPNEAPVLDMFGDESITIKSVVKDLSDPKKLFTEYSRSFTVPASKKNNRIFKHYHNIDVTNGLDSRELLPARILMNNTTYKVGNIQIEGVGMSKGVPSYYKIQFIGKLSELARQIGQDRLSSLDFTSLDINGYDVYDELNNSTLNDVVFPIASRSKRFIYDTGTAASGLDNTLNIGYVNATATDGYGIEAKQVMGALKVGTIISKIESTYGFTITGALKNDYVSNLYLWLRNADKERSGAPKIAQATGWAYDTGDGPLGGITIQTNSMLFSSYPLPGEERYSVSIKGTWTGGDAEVKLYQDGVLLRSVDTSDVYSSSFLITDSPHVYTVTAESASDIFVDVTIKIVTEVYEPPEPDSPGGWLNSSGTDYVLSTATIGDAGLYLVNKNLPKMKIMEFLSSLFKMFNIIAEIDSDLNVSTKHFDHFMSEGELKDVTKYIHLNEYVVDRPNLYSSIQFEFAEPKVAMELGYLAVNGSQYGELSFELIGSTGARLSGSEYKLKIDNQRMPVERLTNLDNNTLSTVVYTQFSDLKGAEQATQPTFTYLASKTGASPLAYTDFSTVSSFSNYIQPSNSFNSSNLTPTRDNTELGLYFGEEISEYHPDESLFGAGLFNSFYRGTVAMMFDEDKRSVTFNAHLPLNIVMDLKLSDTLLISNNFYNINSVETNYLTGVSKLELTLVGRSKLLQFNPGSKTITNNSTTDILYITYMDTSGDLVNTSIAASGSSTQNMIGSVIAVSHFEYTEVLN